MRGRVFFFFNRHAYRSKRNTHVAPRGGVKLRNQRAGVYMRDRLLFSQTHGQIPTQYPRRSTGRCEVKKLKSRGIYICEADLLFFFYRYIDGSKRNTHVAPWTAINLRYQRARVCNMCETDSRFHGHTNRASLNTPVPHYHPKGRYEDAKSALV